MLNPDKEELREKSKIDKSFNKYFGEDEDDLKT
jgi:hypothetical protein